MIIRKVFLALLLHADQAGANERTSDLVDPSPGFFVSHRHTGLSLYCKADHAPEPFPSREPWMSCQEKGLEKERVSQKLGLHGA